MNKKVNALDLSPIGRYVFGEKNYLFVNLLYHIFISTPNKTPPLFSSPLTRGMKEISPRYLTEKYKHKTAPRSGAVLKK